MKLTDADVREIKADIDEAIAMQLRVIRDENAVDALEMIDAITPKRPSTRKLIGWMYYGPGLVKSLKAVTARGEFRIVLTSTTIRSVCEILEREGFSAEVVSIDAKLAQMDDEAAGPVTRH